MWAWLRGSLMTHVSCFIFIHTGVLNAAPARCNSVCPDDTAPPGSCGGTHAVFTVYQAEGVQGEILLSFSIDVDVRGYCTAMHFHKY